MSRPSRALALIAVLTFAAALPLPAQHSITSPGDAAAALRAARISLAEAVLRANRVVAGDVIAARLVAPASGGTAARFVVTILADGELIAVTVDGGSGWAESSVKLGDAHRPPGAAGDASATHPEAGGADAAGAMPPARPDAPHAAQPGDLRASAHFRFDAPGPSGALPDRFEVRETKGKGKPGLWRVEPSGDGGHLRLAVSENSGQTFNLCLLGEARMQDLALSVRLRADAGQEDQGGGLLWRAVDADNYYVARWNPLEDNVRAYRVVSGQRKQLASATVKADRAAWHLLDVTMRGNRFTVAFDHLPLFEVEDATFEGPGQVGLWTKADAATSFDDLILRY